MTLKTIIRFRLSGIVTYTFIGLLIIGCSKNTAAPKKLGTVMGKPYTCDVDLGDHRLSPASSNSIPYEGRKNVVFIDSTGALDTFSISYEPTRRHRMAHHMYDDSVKFDTVGYCYITQFYSYKLNSHKSNLQFRITLNARPLCLVEQIGCADAASRETVHMLDISYSENKPGDRYWYGIFQKTVNRKTISNDSVNKSYAEISFFNRMFNNVEKTEHPEKPRNEYLRGSQLFYNYTEGIVAFSVNGDKTWRFHTMY